MFGKPKSETFWAKVKAAETDEDGRRVNAEFWIQCKRMTIPEASALFEACKEADHPNAEFVDKVVVGWRGEGGNQPPDFSSEALRKESDEGLAGPMIAAFYENLQGARVKN